MLNLARLQVLCEVVSLGSFSAAAESLSYTQSAVSQSIARLEAETGAPLVVRGRRGVSPTAAGAALVAHAERIFEQVREAEADIAAVMGVRSGRLRVGTFPSGGATLMPPAVARFRRSHPDVVLTLEDGEPEEIVPRLRAGELDLALLYEFPGARPRRRRLGAGLRSVRLLEDPIRVALPAEHPLAAEAGAGADRSARRAVGADLGLEPVRPSTSSRPAWGPASSRPSPSSQTTSTRSRGSSPRAWGWR